MIDNSVFSTLKARYVTFGCKLNYAETSTIASLLQQKGVVTAREDEAPDLIVVNTCSVTAIADKKCRQAVRSLNRRFPDALIALMGCYSQLKPDEAASLPGVGIVIGNDGKTKLPEMLEEWLSTRRNAMAVKQARDFDTFEHSCSRGNRTRYFLKVQDGCNYYCSYCTIPYARGHSRSPQISELIDKANEVALAGGKEIILTGVNVGDFGWHKPEKFIDLIRELDKVDGIERFRISSIEPNLLTNEIIEFVAESRHFMPHFHVPLQSGSDHVLRLMRRHYDTALFAERIARIRELLPDAFIGVDLIVGMRGETDTYFNESLDFIEQLDISRLHVFPYSERAGTSALDITPIVDASVKQERMKKILALSTAKEKDFSSRYQGTKRPVLFENYDPGTGQLSGHTDNYIKTIVSDGEGYMVNKISEVILGEPHPDGGEGFFSPAKFPEP